MLCLYRIMRATDMEASTRQLGDPPVTLFADGRELLSSPNNASIPSWMWTGGAHAAGSGGEGGGDAAVWSWSPIAEASRASPLSSLLRRSINNSVIVTTCVLVMICESC